MIIDCLPGGKLGLPACMPLCTPSLGPHYWDEAPERLCNAYWLIAQVIATALHMEIQGYDYKARMIIIAPIVDQPVAVIDDNGIDDNDIPF